MCKFETNGKCYNLELIKEKAGVLTAQLRKDGLDVKGLCKGCKHFRDKAENADRDLDKFFRDKRETEQLGIF